MREFDFDAPVERRGTWSYKWHGAEDNDVIPLWVADMDFCTAPPVVEALQRRAAHGVFGYVAVPDEFYNAAIGWFHRRHGWDIEREWIQYTTGVVPAVSVVIKALTRPGDKVLMLTPIYNCFFSCIRNNGCEIEETTPLAVCGRPRNCRGLATCASGTMCALSVMRFTVSW